MVDRLDNLNQNNLNATPSGADIIELGEQDLEYLNQYQIYQSPIDFYYLASTCFTLLNVNKDLFYKELHEPVNQATLKQFACDKKQRALLIAKIDKSKAGGSALVDGDGKPIASGTSNKKGEYSKVINSTGVIGKDQEPQNQSSLLDGNSGDLDDPFRPIELRFSLKVQYMGQTAHTIAFLKRETYQILELKPQGDASRHLSSQLQILNLGFIGEDSNILYLYQLAATYVEYSLVPLFNTYKTGGPSASDEKGKSTSGLELVQKNLMQLKVHLVQCLQNLDIPEIELTIDPDILIKSEFAKQQQRNLYLSF